MSHENVELTYQAFDAYTRRDFDAALALYDAAIEIAPFWTDPPFSRSRGRT